MTKVKEFKFYPVAILICWMLLLIIIASELFVIRFLLIDEKAYFSTVFLSLLNLLIAYESFPKIIRYSKFFIKNEPAILLTKTHLKDNVNNQIFNWKDIKKIDFNYGYQSNQFSIIVKEPSKFIENEPNAYKRFIMKLNTNYFNGTFSIKPALIKGKKEDILNCLNDFFNKS